MLIKYNISNRSVPKLPCSPILWTPTFIVFANNSSEVRKITGYLNDQLFQSEMEIGRAFSFLRKAQPRTALEILENLIHHEASKSLQPEALYWAGVASYFLHQRNSESLVPHCQELLSAYPENIWGQRADVLNINLQS